MTNNLENYATDKPTRDAWGQIQRSLKCCGIKNFQDWKNVTDVGPSDVPDSCCVTEGNGCGKGVLTGGERSVGSLLALSFTAHRHHHCLLSGQQDERAKTVC